MTEKLLVRTSERTLFGECRFAWKMAYVDKVKNVSQPTYFRFGDLIHQALAAFYVPGDTRGPLPAETFAQLIELHGHNLKNVKSEDEWVDAKALGIDMLEGYVKHWGADSQFRILAPEMPFQVDLYDDEDNYVCTYVGTADALAQDIKTGLLGLLEHKTAAAISTAHLPMNEQSTSYWTFVPDFLKAEGILGEKDDLSFMLFNFLRKAKEDKRDENEHGQKLNLPKKKGGLREVSKNQPKPRYHRHMLRRGHAERDALTWRVIDQVREMNMIRNGELAALKSPGLNCRFCQYREVCEMQEIGADWEEMWAMTLEKWEPYEVHETVDTEAE